MIPTRTGKPEKIWRGFSNEEKSENFAKTGKVRELYPKYWEIRKKYTGKLKKNTGKVREICQPVTLRTLQIWYHTLNLKKKEL